ncbi:MAG TPA: HAD-IIA family hydrolase [Rhizomicrobium sp.]
MEFNPRSQVEQASGILVDWDGCIALGDRPMPAAIQFIRENLERTAIVSNNSTHLPEDFAEILRKSEIAIPVERIVLAGVEALKRAAELRPQGVLVLGDGRIKAYARSLGLRIVHDDADLVVLLRDTRFSYNRLQRAANCLRAGARLIVANPDTTHPGKRGMLVPETGALFAALIASVGDTNVETEIIGKPGPRLFERACDTLGINPSSAIMIGDNPETDIAGAGAIGMQSVLIGARSKIGFQHLITQPANAPRSRSVKQTADNEAT